MTSPFNLDLTIARALGKASIFETHLAVAIFKAELGRCGFRIVDQTFGQDGEPKPSFYFQPGDEIMRPSIDDVVDDVDTVDLRGNVLEVGRLFQLPSVWVTRVPIDDEGGSELEEFGTEAEAQAMANHIYGEAVS